ncbi:hypothetical protein MPH_02839 [Macrophomina phaseolina MS6]|uniref:Uncharacterized protein n=1 Tax=Macrophomina phaseolina (strain MS6) TaxID=1126212 RepID=K2S481_MACPH|nr:hypothetical protein MPH_02839 [Macrophomina phaseolina MS6]
MANRPYFVIAGLPTDDKSLAEYDIKGLYGLDSNVARDQLVAMHAALKEAGYGFSSTIPLCKQHTCTGLIVATQWSMSLLNSARAHLRTLWAKLIIAMESFLATAFAGTPILRLPPFWRS